MSFQIDQSLGARREARGLRGGQWLEDRLASAAAGIAHMPVADVGHKLDELEAARLRRDAHTSETLHDRRGFQSYAGAGQMSGGSLPDIDITTPSPARMYDYYLGGKDNFPADREAAEKALSVVPHGRAVAWVNRRFLVRAVKYLARRRVTQFIDLGSGIPTTPNVHEMARDITPTARIVYVDNDPVVTLHRALLVNGNSNVIALHGDIRHPLDMARNRRLREVIDFRQPVAVLFVGVLRFLTNGEDPYNSVCVFRDLMQAGGYLVLSHITSDGTDPSIIEVTQDAYAKASAPAVFRGRREIRQFFAGVDLVRPGLVEVSEWRTDNRIGADPPAVRFLGGVGRKQ